MGVLHDIGAAILRSTGGTVLLDTCPVQGSADDFAARLRRLLPTGWFPAPPQDGEDEQAPVLAALLQGMGSVFAGSWELMQQAAKQMRLATASGPFLDMIAEDYFGAGGLERTVGETDLRYRNRILRSLISPMNTRAAVSSAVKHVTGYAPRIIEPMNAADCHAFGASGAPGLGGGYGYGMTGLRYGSSQGGQFFLETRSGNSADPNMIYEAVSKTAAIGVIGWVRIDR